MKTLVLGASHKPYRYSYLAVNSLSQNNHEVVAIGRRGRKVDNWEIMEGKPGVEGVHTITLYLNSENQKEYYDYILELKPQRVIFNPGAENPELEQKLEQNGIEAINACTLIMLRTGQY